MPLSCSSCNRDLRALTPTLLRRTYLADLILYPPANPYLSRMLPPNAPAAYAANASPRKLSHTGSRSLGKVSPRLAPGLTPRRPPSAELWQDGVPAQLLSAPAASADPRTPAGDDSLRSLGDSRRGRRQRAPPEIVAIASKRRRTSRGCLGACGPEAQRPPSGFPALFTPGVATRRQGPRGEAWRWRHFGRGPRAGCTRGWRASGATP